MGCTAAGHCYYGGTVGGGQRCKILLREVNGTENHHLTSQKIFVGFHCQRDGANLNLFL